MMRKRSGGGLARFAAVMAVLACGALSLHVAGARAATFQIEAASAKLENDAGQAALQAGSHPNLVTNLVFTSQAGREPLPVRKPRNIDVTLPQGLLGNPTATPRCTMQAVEDEEKCPSDTAVGVVHLKAVIEFDGIVIAIPGTALVYNIVPYASEPAAFGFDAVFPVRLDTQVGPEGGYAVHVSIKDVPEAEEINDIELTLWGVPSQHNGPGSEETGLGRTFGGESEAAPTPFVTAPTSCEESAGAREGVFTSRSWAEKALGTGAIVPSETATSSFLQPLMTGCEHLAVEPRLALLAGSHVAGGPAAYDVGLEVPQNEAATGLATPEVRDVQVTLPEGTLLSPSAANGLSSCSEAQLGIHSNMPGECPNASKVGSVEIITPLLREPLEGSVYVGTPECEPCTGQQTGEGKMVPLLLEAELPGKPESPDVMIKLKGETSVDQQTGRLTTTFANDPQLPFSELKLALKGGEDAPLVNPTTCGPAVASAKLTPWSSPTATEVQAPAIPIEGCAPVGFAPTMQAGMTESARGGSFSPFSLTLERADGQQPLGSVTVQMPPGISGMLSKVPLCGEAQANAGTCPAASQIGTTTAVIGPGSEPYTVEGGKVYLTETYGGGPFGLSIVTPAHAGPFTLAGVNGSGGPGDGTVVIRAAIDINPSTAAITVKTGPLPTQLNGIPLDIDRVIVNVNRPEFTFNPTDCNAMSVAGTITSSTGTAANVSSPFQATDCASLPFKPQFSALIHAHHSRKDGEYLHVVVKSAFGQANIHQVHVQLPGKLPSRLSTLKLACTEQQFAANPAGCPPGSFVGTAVAHTPVLPVPLAGPAVFVSHAGKGFPDLDLVLQGDGVHVTLVGDTYINKHSITTSTFKTVPDVPVTRFDLVLPAGEHSALAGDGNMCAKPLYMPTTLTGQNGAVVKHRTKVAVTGCKPELHVLKTRRHGAKATIVVRVPSAGKLVASGAGIGRAVEKAKHATRVSMTVRLKRHVRQMLARHHHRRLKVIVHLRFKARRGGQIKAHVKLLMR